MSLPETAYIMDTETTGKDPAVDQVIELARLEMPATPAEFLKMPLDSVTFHQFYGHTAPMALGAIATHMIDPDKLVGLEPFKSVDYAGRFAIGHNVDFDCKMTNLVGCLQIDTLPLSRMLWPELDSHTQSAVLLHIGRLTNKPTSWALNLIKNAHQADADVLNCARILKYIVWLIMKNHELKGSLSWHDLHQVTQDARIPKVMTFGKHKGVAVEDVDQGWIDWYATATNPPPDPYVLMAFRKAGRLA